MIFVEWRKRPSRVSLGVLIAGSEYFIPEELIPTINQSFFFFFGSWPRKGEKNVSETNVTEKLSLRVRSTSKQNRWELKNAKTTRDVYKGFPRSEFPKHPRFCFVFFPSLICRSLARLLVTQYQSSLRPSQEPAEIEVEDSC